VCVERCCDGLVPIKVLENFETTASHYLDSSSQTIIDYNTMCGSMVDIQSPTAQIRQGKKERRHKSQGKNIMVCPVP